MWMWIVHQRIRAEEGRDASLSTWVEKKGALSSQRVSCHVIICKEKKENGRNDDEEETALANDHGSRCRMWRAIIPV